MEIYARSVVYLRVGCNFMKTLLQILFLLLFITNCAAPDAAPEIKEEAKLFFKTIVKTYFDKDCDKFYSLFNDKVTIIGSYGDGVFSSKEMVESRKANSLYRYDF